MKTKIHAHLALTLCALACFARGAAADEPTVTRLACVGDSITVGAGTCDRETKSYPALLKGWLGPKWQVENFGASGATLLQKGNLPYFERPQFKQALAFKPDVAVVTFGANDSKHGAPDNPKIADNWRYKAEFVADYRALLSEFRKANPDVKFYLGLPVAAFGNRYGIDGAVIENEIVPLVRQIAAQEGAQIIDINSVVNTPDLFRDGVHPNDAGTELMATTIYRALAQQEPPTTAATSPAVSLPAPENFHLYLLMGQSNMAGRAPIDATQTGNPRVLALNEQGQWVVARDPIHAQVGRTVPGGGPGIPFALDMIAADPNVTIGLIPAAIGGSPLRRWNKGKNGDLYDNADQTGEKCDAGRHAQRLLVASGRIGHQQPEKCRNLPGASRRKCSEICAPIWTRPTLPVVVGQLGEFLALTPDKYPFEATVRAAIVKVSETVPNVGYADSAGLGDKGDKLHFDAPAQKEMGARFARAMKELQKP